MSPRWQASQLQLDLDPQYTLIVKWHTQRLQDSSKASHQRPKCGWWPSSWNLPPSPRQSSHSLAYGITQPMNNKHTTFQGHPHPLQWTTLCLWSVFLWKNPHLTYHFVSFFELLLHWDLSALNSFYIEFFLHWDKNLSFIRSWNQVCELSWKTMDSGFESQSEINSFSNLWEASARAGT